MFDLDGNLRFAYPTEKVTFTSLQIEGKHIFTMFHIAEDSEPLAITTKDKNNPIVRINKYPFWHNGAFILANYDEFRIMLLNGELLADVCNSYQDAMKLIDNISEVKKSCDIEIPEHILRYFR